MIEEREENEAWQITSIRGRSPPSFHVLGFALAPPDTHAGWDLNRVMNAIEFAPLQRGALQELPNPLLHALGPFDIQLEARDLLVEHVHAAATAAGRLPASLAVRHHDASFAFHLNDLISKDVLR